MILEALIQILKHRFEENLERHKNISWDEVEKKLNNAGDDKIQSLRRMEETGGEPDVVGYDENTDEFIFYDCSPESPMGRRSLCYDKEALKSRKKFPPKDDAISVSRSIGIEILTEEEYRSLQQLGTFDSKTSSWIKTPEEIRKLGGAIFADFRFGKIFIYHNSAESYYASRGFRGSLRVQ